MAAGLPQSLSRSRSLPTVDKGVCGEWEDDIEGEGTGGRDSGVVVVASDHASFASDARSSLLGDLPSGLAVSELPSEEIPEEARGGTGQTEDPNKKETIGRHYYPEGGWGWVVVVMALMVQVVAHGLHQAGGVMLLHTLAKFPESSLLAASKLTCLFVYCLVVGVIRVTCPHFFLVVVSEVVRLFQPFYFPYTYLTHLCWQVCSYLICLLHIPQTSQLSPFTFIPSSHPSYISTCL